MKRGKLVILRDLRKKSQKTHTINSASIYPDDSDLTMEQLENVVGGMSQERFSTWRASI